MIRNPNTFSWERIFLVLFVLLNPDVSVSGSGQAWFQQMLFLVYNSDGLIQTPTHVHTHTFSCVTQGDLGAWRLRNNYRPLARRLVGDGVTRGVTWAKHEAWLITVTFINTCHCFPLNGGPGCCYFLVLVSKDDKLFYCEVKNQYLSTWLCHLLVFLWATGQPCWSYKHCMNV